LLRPASPLICSKQACSLLSTGRQGAKIRTNRASCRVEGYWANQENRRAQCTRSPSR
jgi:hypothetical protein